MGSLTILRNEIRKAKKYYYCDDCGNLIGPGNNYQYLYGRIEIWEKMTVMRYCTKCISIRIHEDEDYNQIKPCPHKDCDYWGQGGCMLPGKCIYAGDNMEGRGVYE